MKKAIIGAFVVLALVGALVTAQSGITLPAGSSTLKSIHLTGVPGLGVYWPTSSTMYIGGTSGGITFSDTAASVPDISATTGTITTGTVTTLTTSSLTLTDGTYGASFVDGVNIELIDLGGADELAAVQSTASLIPANSIVLAVAVRCTEAFAGDVANFDLGDESTSDRFVTNSTKVAEDDTAVVNEDGVLFGASASKIEVLLDDAATAGMLRVSVFYRQFVAPTS